MVQLDRHKIRKQRKLYQRRIDHPTTENIRKHAAYRNKLRTEIKAAKRKHLIEKLQLASQDPKQQAKDHQISNPVQKARPNIPPQSLTKAKQSQPQSK